MTRATLTVGVGVSRDGDIRHARKPTARRRPATLSARLFASGTALALALAALAASLGAAEAMAAGAKDGASPAELAPAAIDKRLAGAGTLADFDAALAEIVAAMGRAARGKTPLSRDALSTMIGRFTAFERFQELTAGRAACDVMVPLIGFGYAPREDNPDPRTLPSEAQEVIALVPHYCTLAKKGR